MKTKTVYCFILFISLFLLGVFLASFIEYALLLYTGPLVFLYPALVRFTPLGFYVELLYLDSFPYPLWFFAGYRPPLIVPVDSQHYFSIFYAGATAIVLDITVLSTLAFLIRPLWGMPEYEYFHEIWAGIRSLFTKSSKKKKLTISFIIILQIIAGLLFLIMYSGIFQIIPLTETAIYIYAITAVGLLMLSSTILSKKRLIQLYEQD